MVTYGLQAPNILRIDLDLWPVGTWHTKTCLVFAPQLKILEETSNKTKQKRWLMQSSNITFTEIKWLRRITVTWGPYCLFLVLPNERKSLSRSSWRSWARKHQTFPSLSTDQKLRRTMAVPLSMKQAARDKGTCLKERNPVYPLAGPLVHQVLTCQITFLLSSFLPSEREYRCFSSERMW